MFKCSTGSLTLLWLLVFSTAALADVYKWKDANGKTHYGDVPNMAGTAQVKTDKQTDDQIANGERIRGEMENSAKQDAMKEARDSAAKDTGKCKFKYFTNNDGHGKNLASAAKEECLNNEALKKVGQGSQTSYVAYNTWKDNYQITSNQRNANAQRIQNAEAQRQQQETLSDIERNQKSIERNQERTLSNIDSSIMPGAMGKMIISDRGYGSSTSGSTEIEMRRKHDYDPANKYRGEIDGDGTVRMKNLNGDRLRGTIEKDGYGKLRDEDGNTYRVKPQ